MKLPIDIGQSYAATLTDVTLRDGKKGPYLMWVFIDSDGTRRVGFTDGEIRTGNRTWTWLCMLGIHVEVGGTVDLTQLKNIECQIFLGVGEEIVRMVHKPTAIKAAPAQVEVKKDTPTASADGQTEADFLFK